MKKISTFLEPKDLKTLHKVRDVMGFDTTSEFLRHVVCTYLQRKKGFYGIRD